MSKQNQNEPVHCDEYIWSNKMFGQPDCLKWYLFINRQPAHLKMLAHSMGIEPKLFADYNGKRVRVVMASRFGDVGITTDLNAEHGYSERVAVEDLTNFSDKE